MPKFHMAVFLESSTFLWHKKIRFSLHIQKELNNTVIENNPQSSAFT